MAVRIDGVQQGSYAQVLGIQPGERLVSINGHSVNDVLDYRFYETEQQLELELERPAGERYRLHLRKGQYESLGLEFESYLMDQERSCRNKCVFCFIDQLPKGMRETMYFKDDDARLSFLFGNYITLTNIGEEEIRRMIRMRISPINISVHTMNPELRCRMMNNRFAGEKLAYLSMLTQGGIKINCQLVLCPGLNDGKELEFTLAELEKLGENLQSVACVPVGLTRYRENLPKLTPFQKDTAAAVIDTVNAFGEKMLALGRSRTFYPSDEFYLLAQRELPPYEYYEDFPQIENGVGMFRDLEESFLGRVEDMDSQECQTEGSVAVVTGTAIYPLMQELLDELRVKCDNLTIELLPITNDFFGGTVDVAGLVTGGDILRQLRGRLQAQRLLVPSVMLKADEDVFLDDVTLEELSQQLGIQVEKAGFTGEDLVEAILGKRG